MLNKSEYVSRAEMGKMKSVLYTLLRESKLLAYKGSLSTPDAVSHTNSSRRVLSVSNSARRRALPGDADEVESVNFVCLPKIDRVTSSSTSNSGATGETESLPMTMNEFNGLPSSARCVKNLLRELLALKRNNCVFMNNAAAVGVTGSLMNSTVTGSTPAMSNRDQIFTEKRWSVIIIILFDKF